MNKIFQILTIVVMMINAHVDCVCFKILPTTTMDINYLCQFNTGVRLNSTALGQLVRLGSFNYTNVGTNADECCLVCNTKNNCDYAFETQNVDGSTRCDYYHWNIPSSLTEDELIYQIKQGDWYERKPYSKGSGKLLYANTFLKLVW